jgi:hypothetical protein
MAADPHSVHPPSDRGLFWHQPEHLLKFWWNSWGKGQPSSMRERANNHVQMRGIWPAVIGWFRGRLYEHPVLPKRRPLCCSIAEWWGVLWVRPHVLHRGPIECQPTLQMLALPWTAQAILIFSWLRLYSCGRYPVKPARLRGHSTSCKRVFFQLQDLRQMARMHRYVWNLTALTKRVPLTADDL